jgi:hypothetical protein
LKKWEKSSEEIKVTWARRRIKVSSTFKFSIFCKVFEKSPQNKSPQTTQPTSIQRKVRSQIQKVTQSKTQVRITSRVIKNKATAVASFIKDSPSKI